MCHLFDAFFTRTMLGSQVWYYTFVIIYLLISLFTSSSMVNLLSSPTYPLLDSKAMTRHFGIYVWHIEGGPGEQVDVYSELRLVQTLLLKREKFLYLLLGDPMDLFVPSSSIFLAWAFRSLCLVWDPILWCLCHTLRGREQPNGWHLPSSSPGYSGNTPAFFWSHRTVLTRLLGSKYFRTRYWWIWSPLMSWWSICQGWHYMEMRRPPWGN